MVRDRIEKGSRLRRAARVAVAVVLCVACGRGGAPVPGSAEDLDALGAAVIEAFNQDDTGALASLRLTEEEHNRVVWPELPAARGESPFPVDLAWQNIELRNRRAVGRLRHDLATMMPMVFEGVECRGETRAFESFQVQTDCYTRFSHGGSRWEVQLFKDVLDREGGLKIFRYYDEVPRPIGGGG